MIKLRRYTHFVHQTCTLSPTSLVYYCYKYREIIMPSNIMQSHV